MIALLLLCLGVSPISSHPVSGGKACSTLTSFQKSLDNAVMCKDFQPKTECTTASLEIVKKCLDGIKVDAKCLSEVYEKLSGDQDCFCGGLVKFSQMLTSVEALLCAEDQGRVSKLFFANMFDLKQETTTTATTSATSTATTTGTGTTAATTTRAPRLIFPNQGTTAATATTASTQSTTRAPRLIFPNQGSTTAATTASTQTTTTRAPRLFFPNNLNLPNIFGNNGGDAAKPEPDTTTAATTTASTASTATSAASTTTASQTTTTAAATTTTAAPTTTTAAPTTTTTAATTTTTAAATTTTMA